MTTIPEDYAMISHEFGGAAAPWGAMITYGVAGPFLIAPNQVAEFCHGAVAGGLMHQMSSSLTLVRTICKEGPDETGPTGEYIANVNGSLAANSAPPGVAAVCKKTTALGGRKHRGRFYMPGLLENRVNPSGDIDSDYVEDIQTELDAMITYLDETGGLPMVLLHNDATAPDVIERVVCEVTVGTQRQRQRR
jgi:hypothetical protein